jgi:hypothetical protein
MAKITLKLSAIKAYEVSRGIAPFTLDLGTTGG